jgi:hypothetical protein
MKVRIQQNYRIEIGSVEKLMDIKAKTGTSINELVNKMIKLGIESFLEQEIDAAIAEKTPIKLPHTEPVIALLSEEKKTEQKKNGVGGDGWNLGADLLGDNKDE